MDDRVSAKSEISRLDAACGVAMIAREMCGSVDVITFSNRCVLVPPRRGFALADCINRSQPHGGTDTRSGVIVSNDRNPDRIILITDEQSRTSIPDPKKAGYCINVASAKNGIGYGKWIHVDGWSEAVVDYITEYESSFKEQR
jgi:hypothetical protein